VARGQWPMGVGAYTGADQPTIPADDGHLPPLEDKPVPPGAPVPPRRPLGRGFLAILVLVVALVVAVGVIAMFAFVVPAQYAEHQTLTLNSEQGWRQSVCVPTWSLPGWVTTHVSFAWRTGGPYPVTLPASYAAWPAWVLAPIHQIVYNATGSSGSGWYLSGPYPGNSGTEEFAAVGASNPSDSVTVTISYEGAGHYLGGPSLSPTC